MDGLRCRQSDPGLGVIRASQVYLGLLRSCCNICVYFAHTIRFGLRRVLLITDLAAWNGFLLKLPQLSVSIAMPARGRMIAGQTELYSWFVLAVGTDSGIDSSAAAAAVGTAGPSSSAAARRGQSRRLPPSPPRTRHGSSPPRSKRRRVSKYGSDGSVDEEGKEHELYCTAQSGSVSSGDPAAEGDDDYNTSKPPGFALSLSTLPPFVGMTARIQTTHGSPPMGMQSLLTVWAPFDSTVHTCHQQSLTHNSADISDVMQPSTCARLVWVQMWRS